MFNIEDYNYELPEDLIAQIPERTRDRSRLLFLKRDGGSVSDHHFFDLPRLLEPGDLLVINNTRVIPARLFGHKSSGGQIEVLVLADEHEGTPESNTRWCLFKSSKRPQKGNRLFFDSGISGLVEDLGKDGLVRIAFQSPEPIDTILDAEGVMPLPPYIKRPRDNDLRPLDRDRYQTVFSKEKGAVAAPTAGLHFTETLVESLIESGITVEELTLHVGHGTFKPVRTKDIRNHQLGEERFMVSEKTTDAVNRSKKEGRRVIAVGTTVVRTLETLAGPGGKISPGNGKTELLITPGYPFKIIDGMITNFHLPKSSLLFLVSAFAGLNLIKRAYLGAVEKKYRFYSYGDAMLIL